MLSKNRKNKLRVIAVLLVTFGAVVLVYALYSRSDAIDKATVFSDRTMLAGLWNSYKKEYWESSTGRTLDKQSNYVTTSEGQSYTMLRAVWQSDQPTFDKAWLWTKQQLQRPDHLFSWRWGQRSDKTYGILTDQDGFNTASDADSDIALALLMAASRWQDKTYLAEARVIIPAIWQNEVITVNAKPYLASNNLEKDSRNDAIINPSYFAPYAYRQFARIDPTHDWTGLVDSSYELLNRVIDEKLGLTTSAQLVPDWVALNKQTDVISAVAAPRTLTTNYGYDAMRAAWRLGLDHEWNKDNRARQTLQKLQLLKNEWTTNQVLYSTYSHDGRALSSDQVPESYGTSIGYFMVVEPDLARQVYDKKLKTLYDQNTNSWAQSMSYYSDNWAWFGMALFQHQLDNLAAGLK